MQAQRQNETRSKVVSFTEYILFSNSSRLIQAVACNLSFPVVNRVVKLHLSRNYHFKLINKQAYTIKLS